MCVSVHVLVCVDSVRLNQSVVGVSVHCSINPWLSIEWAIYVGSMGFGRHNYRSGPLNFTQAERTENSFTAYTHCFLHHFRYLLLVCSFLGQKSAFHLIRIFSLIKFAEIGKTEVYEVKKMLSKFTKLCGEKTYFIDPKLAFFLSLLKRENYVGGT